MKKLSDFIRLVTARLSGNMEHGMAEGTRQEPGSRNACPGNKQSSSRHGVDRAQSDVAERLWCGAQHL